MTLSAISRRLAASSVLRRPPMRPSALAAARPAEVRSRIMARSNSAKAPTICIIIRPAGVVGASRAGTAGRTTAGRHQGVRGRRPRLRRPETLPDADRRTVLRLRHPLPAGREMPPVANERLQLLERQDLAQQRSAL